LTQYLPKHQQAKYHSPFPLPFCLHRSLNLIIIIIIITGTTNCTKRFNNNMRTVSFLFAAAVASSVPSSASGFSFSNPNAKISAATQEKKNAADSIITSNTDRRRFLHEVPVIFGLTLATSASPAFAKEQQEAVPAAVTRELVKATFDPIRYEISDPKGGVAYMQQQIDAQDFTTLIDFTRGYDLEMRKIRMGKAKKLLQTKELKEKGTEYANAVTFDLIGMNRNCRKGQESVEGANKYLQELRDDAAKFLELEKTIEVEG
jgi:hypothetical protein